MKKKICLVGGEDAHKRINLSRYLIEFGFEVTILGTGTKPFPKEINYVGYNLNRSFSPTSDYKTLLWYKRFFNENRFDIIHTFDTKPCFLVPLALLKNKTPITRTITGLGAIFTSKSVFSFILRNVYTLFHFIVRQRVTMTTFQNEDDRDIYLSRKLITANNHKMIFGSGIELKHITQKASRNNEQFTFICVARLVYGKGIVNLLEAARICSSKGYTFKYLLVGPLEEHSKHLNENILKVYEDIVDVLGTRHDVFDLLLASDAFVLPTFREGFARVLMEAASVGLPIVSTNVPGVREFARHNKEALIVEPKDSKALAEAMITMATNKPLADKLAKNALHRVELFNLENISKQYISIFNAAINHN
jgi:glycosyltransferase involved in cell wall biosynthesis